MSYENVPKNLSEKAVLTRGGRADYEKLLAAAFPTPAAAEAGAELEVTDTGDRYRWSGTTWFQIVRGGGLIVSSGDFFTDVSRGIYPNLSTGFMLGHNPNLGATATETLWDLGGNKTYLGADTTLYLSSDNAADTTITVLLTGLDDTYTQVTATAVTNGTAGVAFATDMFRTFSAVCIINSPVGNLYVGTEAAPAAGVPALANTEQKIPLAMDTAGGIIDTGTAFASDNSSHSGAYTVPAGHRLINYNAIVGVGKNQNASVGGRIRSSATAPWLNRNPQPIYQSNIMLPFQPPLVLPEKFDFELRAVAASANSFASMQLLFILEKL